MRPKFCMCLRGPTRVESQPIDHAQERVQLDSLLEQGGTVCSAPSRFDVAFFVPGKDPFSFFFPPSLPWKPLPDSSPSAFCFCCCCETFPPILSCFELPPDPSATGNGAGLYECSASISVALACLTWLDLQASTRLFIAKPWSPLMLCYIT